jgi:1,4-dihydroxy-2-naphthoate polyprenyltransferase
MPSRRRAAEPAAPEPAGAAPAARHRAAAPSAEAPAPTRASSRLRDVGARSAPPGAPSEPAAAGAPRTPVAAAYAAPAPPLRADTNSLANCIIALRPWSWTAGTVPSILAALGAALPHAAAGSPLPLETLARALAPALTAVLAVQAATNARNTLVD